MILSLYCKSGIKYFIEDVKYKTDFKFSHI